mmetsp:Transcript_27616/g.57835  ORF Transcript_27616/g.57835 Transcript_27616/m.57835 type:complete len:202 (-) Transcript_27616:238-843(-)
MDSKRKTRHHTTRHDSFMDCPTSVPFFSCKDRCGVVPRFPGRGSTIRDDTRRDAVLVWNHRLLVRDTPNPCAKVSEHFPPQWFPFLVRRACWHDAKQRKTPTHPRSCHWFGPPSHLAIGTNRWHSLVTTRRRRLWHYRRLCGNREHQRQGQRRRRRQRQHRRQHRRQWIASSCSSRSTHGLIFFPILAGHIVFESLLGANG